MMKQNRRILLLTHNYPRWQGDYAGVFLQQLVDYFREDDISVDVCAPHFKNCPVNETDDNLTVTRFRYAPEKHETLAYSGNMHKQVKSFTGLIKFKFFLISFFFSAFKVLKRENPKLIFAHWLVPAGFVGYFLSLLTGKPLFLASHGTDIALLEKSSLLRFLAKLFFKRAKNVFMVSTYLREKILDLDLVLPAKLIVAPMPVRMDLFGNQKVVEKEVPLILSVARFTKQKQLNILFQSLHDLKKERINFSCEVYGEGELENELHQLIRELELQDIVKLKPPVSQDELAKIYSSARITVLPSINEGYGMTLVEAQLSGSAVIGANSGGIIDIINHEETGLLFKPGNHSQLTSQIKALITDKQLYHHLIINARRSAEEKFSPQNIIEIYKKILSI